MRDTSLIIFLSTMPLLASISHDALLTYQDGMSELKMADLGFLWTEYAFGSYQNAAKTWDQELWKTIAGVLTYKATLVTLALPVLVTILTMPLKIIGALASMGGESKKPKENKKYSRFND